MVIGSNPIKWRGQDSYSGYKNLAQCIFSCRKIPQLLKSLQSVCVVFFAFVILQNGGGSIGSHKSGLVESAFARKAAFWILKPSIDALQLFNYRKWSLYSGRPWVLLAIRNMQSTNIGQLVQLSAKATVRNLEKKHV